MIESIIEDEATLLSSEDAAAAAAAADEDAVVDAAAEPLSADEGFEVASEVLLAEEEAA